MHGGGTELDLNVNNSSHKNDTKYTDAATGELQQLMSQTVKMITTQSRESFICRCVKMGYVTGMFFEADDVMFHRILYNKAHVLHTFLPDRPLISYSLHTRTHNKSLICKTSDLNERNFIVRSLFKDCY